MIGQLPVLVDAPRVPVAAAQAEAPPLDPQRLLSRFRGRLPLFALVALAVAGMVIAMVATSPASYTAAASVLIAQRSPGLLKPTDDGSGVARQLDSAAVDTQVELLRSRALADRVVQRLHLIDDPEFNTSLRRPSLLARAKAWIAQLAGSKPASSRPAPPPPAPETTAERVSDALLSHLKVTRLGATYILSAAVTADAPRKAREIANAFAESFLATQVGEKVDANRSRDGSLRTRLADLRGQVEAAETAVEQYKIDHNLLSAQGQTLTEQEISALDQQLALTRAQQTESEARASTARSQLARGSRGDDVGESLSSPVIQQLRQQRAAASQKVAELSGRYGERHPAMISARRNLADIESLIQEEIKRVISNLDAQAQVARQRTASVETSVTRARGALAGTNRSSVKLNELQRDLDSVRSLYETLLNRFKETNTEEGLEQSEARIVSPAQTPTGPSGPKHAVGFALALALGLFAGVGAVAAAEMMDTSFSTAESLREAAGLPCLASLPTVSSTLRRGQKVPGSPIDYVSDQPLSSFAEAFRSLKTALVLSSSGGALRVLAITSPLPNEGKSTTAMCLGRALALAGVSTVVVDCDLRRHALSRSVARHVSVGLTEVLRGECTLDEALMRDPVSGAFLLPISNRPQAVGDLFASETARKIIGELRSRFGFVILDTAPVLPIAETRVLSTLADGVLLLVRWRTTPANAVRNALRMLQGVNAPLLGTALTFVDLKRQAKTGYGDPEFFYSAYRDYYR